MPTKKKDSAIDIGGHQSSAILGVHTSELKIELSPVHGRAPMFTRPIPGSNNAHLATPPGPPVHVDLGANPTFMRNPSALPPSVDLGVNPTFTRTPAMSLNPQVDLGINPAFTRRIPGNKATPSALLNNIDLGVNPTFTRVVPPNASHTAEKVGKVELLSNAMFTRAIPDSATHVRTTSARIDPHGVVADMQVYFDPGSASNPPSGEHPIFGRNVLASSANPNMTSSLQEDSATVTAILSTSQKVSDALNLPWIRLHHRTPPVPPAYKFISPFVADHVITDDAAFTGNKIFRPPSYSIHGEMRHTKSQAAGPVPLVGRCSPPLDHTKLNLDSLQCTSNFDPPVTFNYTRTHLECVHERVMSNSGRYAYLDMVEMLAGARRNQLQMEMRLQNVLSLELKELQNIREMLEQQLEALDEVEELESSE